MKLYSSNESYKLYQGDMLDMLDNIDKESIDAILTDPPYELNFMNKGWDNSGIAFNSDTWKKCYEVLKPGGYLLAFGGSRTFHRIACAIEDAGFEIRDTIMWLYGSGFPKSLNIGTAIDKKNGVKSKVVRTGKSGVSSRAYQSEETTTAGNYEIKEAQNKWNGWGSCLKPSFEPIIVARKPFKGGLIDNVLENGVGGLNIDECRVENTNADTYDLEKRKVSQATGSDNDGHFLDQLHNQDAKHGVTEQGRFPANTILTYDETDFDEVCGGFPNTKGSKVKEKGAYGFCFSNEKRDSKPMADGYDDSGSASRYFMNCKYTGKDEEIKFGQKRYLYTPKASKKDRDEGLDNQEEVKVNDGRQTPIDNPFQRGETPRRNGHPTVKPCNLMQYLVRLVTPDNGTILDPFNGSGSTGKAVMYENKERNKNYKYIGIELTDEYLPIAKARIEYVCNLEEDKLKDMQMSIFDYLGESNE